MNQNEVIKALMCCVLQKDCRECPLHEHIGKCKSILFQNAVAHIKQELESIKPVKTIDSRRDFEHERLTYIGSSGPYDKQDDLLYPENRREDIRKIIERV